jgi:hypothetical protein
VTSTLDEFKVPLGNQFLGGSSPEINKRSAAEAAAQTGAPLFFHYRERTRSVGERTQLRFEKQPKILFFKSTVRADRLFNQHVQ